MLGTYNLPHSKFKVKMKTLQYKLIYNKPQVYISWLGIRIYPTLNNIYSQFLFII